MYNLTCEISIGSYKLSRVTNVEIESSWDMLTSTCDITLPRKTLFKDKKIAKDGVIKKGDKVIVKLGYNGDLTIRFIGYIRSISSTVPLIIKCEDEAFNLKKGSITKSYKNVNLDTLLKDLGLVHIGAQPSKLGLGPFRISRATPAQVLQHLKDEYLLQFWFRDEKLYAGLAYWPETRKEHKISFEKYELENNLEYRNEEDISILLKVINITPDNKKVEYEYGDQSGEVRTIHYYNRSKADIDLLAKEDLNKMRYTGYFGSFTTFGIPYMNHGDVVTLSSICYPERDGKYLIKKVTNRFGQSGFRQIIEIDIKVND